MSTTGRIRDGFLSAVLALMVIGSPARAESHLYAHSQTNRAYPVGYWKILPVGLFAQEQSNWCWAAVTQTVLWAYDTHVAQCNLADQFAAGRPLGHCCGPAGREVSCDRPIDVAWPLDRYGIRTATVTEKLDLKAIGKELDAGHPLIVTVGESEDAHAMVLYGYSRAGRLIKLWDPLPVGLGKTVEISFDRFYRDGYEGRQWIETQTTAPAPR
jgi:hypothetical protein